MTKLKIALLFLIITASTAAFACDCVVYTIEQIIPITEVIIRGRFISVENNPFPLMPGEKEEDRLYYEGRIIVTEVLKGEKIKVGDTITVKSDYSDCSVYYKMSKEYLFFASKRDNGIESDGCSFTTEYDAIGKNDWYQETKKLLEKK